MRKRMDGAGRPRRLVAGRGGWIVTVVLATVGTAIAFTAGSSAQSNRWNGPQPDQQGRLVPDLVQILPGQVNIAYHRNRWHQRRTLLTFAAAVENHGSGPLIIKATRRSPHQRTMVARQVVLHADGSKEVIRNVGRVKFVRSRDHRHWHFLDFMRYELRTRDGWLIGRDHKTGYCLGDRYRVQNHSFPGTPHWPVFTHQCGRSQPWKMSVNEGISVGYGDLYAAFLEGQFIDITGVSSGNYLLVQKVNPNHRLLDQHSDNDVSTAVVHIQRHHGQTHAWISKWCTSTDRCRRLVR